MPVEQCPLPPVAPLIYHFAQIETAGSGSMRSSAGCGYRASISGWHTLVIRKDHHRSEFVCHSATLSVQSGKTVEPQQLVADVACITPLRLSHAITHPCRNCLSTDPCGIAQRETESPRAHYSAAAAAAAIIASSSASDHDELLFLF